MSLHIVRTTDERLVSPAVAASLRQALAREGRAVLLVPSFAAQLDASRALAALGGLSLGVTVTTPLAWAKERWEVWGDGSVTVEATTRTIALQQVLARQAQGGSHAERPIPLAYNPGTVNVLVRLASRALPWLPLDPSGEPNRLVTSLVGLTEAEVAALGVVGSYARLVRSLGYVEESEVLARVVPALQDQGVPIPPVTLVGFGALRRAERELVADLAGACEVTLVSRRINPRVGEVLDQTLEQVAQAAGERGAVVTYADDPVAGGRSATAPLARTPGLVALTQELFSGRAGGLASEGEQAVSLLVAAGPTAEAELVAQEVERLAAAGCRHIVISSRDVARSWRELAPKLVARDLSVHAELRVPINRLQAGRAFLEFAATVARLGELAATWPPDEPSEEGDLIRLGDMLWWPPSGLTDFLQSDLSGVPLARAERIDVAWRADRLLTPSDVLDLLQNERRTSPQVAAATRELLRGRLGSAASKLLAPFVARAGVAVEDYVMGENGEVVCVRPRPRDELADACSVGALVGMLRVAGTLKELGVTADPASPGAVTLSELVELARQALSQTQLVLRPAAGVDGPHGSDPTQVEVLDASRVAQLQPGSADALVVLGQTTAESPVSAGDDVADAILQGLGIEPERDALAEERISFASQACVPRLRLAVERTERDGASKECYPSVMLTELLACYRRPEELPVTRLGEQDAAANVSARGEAPRQVAEETPSTAGRISAALRSLVVVPQEGRPELLDGRPVLSASQIESYLECPYKWFSLRRLRLKDADAGFSAVEMGTFAHRVLEVTHRQLLQQALEGMPALCSEPLDPELAPWERIPGSRVVEGDEAGLARARGLLTDEFDAHLRHQFLRRGKRGRYQAFVPHTATDEGMLRGLRRDLLSVLDYEAGLFVGFEPRFFEWGFGRHDELVEYAGAYLTGTIDRVDVDAHGQAVVIDYKHKVSSGFAAEYGAFGEGGPEAGDEPGVGSSARIELPRRVQSLIYGQVVRHRRPDLKVVAAVYLATRGQSHALSGAISANVLDNVYGSHTPSDKALPRVAVPGHEAFGQAGESGMDALLDATEAAIAEKVDELMHGNIEARPKDSEACQWCPVMNCERRLSR